MWGVSEIAAMATDLAEFLGGAIGLSLLFGMPLLAGMLVTGVIVYGILMFERLGFRPVELIIGNLVALIALCYLIEMLIAPVDWRSAAVHMVLPELPDAQALLLSVGIIGATVMPHAVYLHSGLTQARIPSRHDGDKRMLVRISNVEVIVALAIAGLVNMSMVMMASGAFHLATARSPRSRAPITPSRRCSEARRPASFSSPCWLPACRVRQSEPWPARSSCRASSAFAFPSGCAGWSR